MSDEYKEVKIPWPYIDPIKATFNMEGLDVATAQMGFWLEYREYIEQSLTIWTDQGWELYEWSEGVLLEVEVGLDRKPYAKPIGYRAKLRRLIKDGN